MSWVCNLSASEYVEAAKYHKDTTVDFIEKALLLMKSQPYEITTGCSVFGKQIKKRANQVLREIHLLSAYLRLQPYQEMILVGSCKPEHNSVYFIAKTIAKRFDQFIIVIFSSSDFAVVSNRRDIPHFPNFSGSSREDIINSVRDFAARNITQKLPEDLILDEGDLLWEKYYETQFLEQRLNPKLFHKFIPKYAIEKAEMKIEGKFLKKIEHQSKKECSTLDSFL